MPFAGIDIGSTMTKAVIVDGHGTVVASVIGPTGAEHRHLALAVMDETIKKAGLSFEQLDFIVATGYGRINVPFADKQITEITCHSRSIRALFPTVRIIIDIGGQDSKGIKLDTEGRRESRKPSCRCMSPAFPRMNFFWGKFWPSCWWRWAKRY